MSELVKAVDVSNYTGEISAEAVAALVEAGIEHVVVRLSLEDEAKRAIAVQQLRACGEGGLGVSGYLWCYWDEGPGQAVSDALALAREAGWPLATLWLDCEDAGPGAAAVVEWLKRAVEVAGWSGQRVGIYTRASWWLAETDDSDALSGLPLWYADYDGYPSIAGFAAFGGWWPAGKQYFGLDGAVWADG